MTRCPKCRYALVRDCCPVCAGKRVKGVPAAPMKPATVTAVAIAVNSPAPLYWSPAR